ncbi:hypothetical protein [Basilea psittacipulmonis]|uniref:Uncharacterized protein n=1 Tax=Basilea psittacipulmonis DSM 24701 TaxID=1072685 RepID=A0A077DDQ6_9BURK|nr:hypothetical protein [Basilea psittacipulmonis]AIL32729.1 hypothetical protein IX83_04890 [Basilea psittacipulmonis DSM 24701]
MSRSYRKTSICGYSCAESEKQDKLMVNRKFRRCSRQLIKMGKDAPIHLREISRRWLFKKIGKQYFDAKDYPKGMRK